MKDDTRTDKIITTVWGLDIKLSSRWIQTFEGRIAWYTIISLAATGIVEVVMAFLIYKVAGKLRYMGYRSAMLGPDGLYPGYRLMILGVCGALTFFVYFLRPDPQIYELCADAGTCHAGYCKRKSGSGDSRRE